MLRRLALVLALGAGALAAGAPGVSLAQSGAACAAIADDADRLACYDAVFRTAAAETGDAVILESEGLIPARPSGREPATVTIACKAGEVAAIFGFAGQLVSVTGRNAPLTLQVDQNATKVRTLAASEDNTTLRFTTSFDTRDFLDSLRGGSSLRVRLTPVGMRSLTMIFRIDGRLAEIQHLRDSCQ